MELKNDTWKCDGCGREEADPPRIDWRIFPPNGWLGEGSPTFAADYHYCPSCYSIVEGFMRVGLATPNCRPMVVRQCGECTTSTS